MTKQRRFSTLLLLLPLLLGLTSCIRYRVEYEIVDKEHVRLNWNIGVRKPENGVKAPEDLTVENICRTVVEHAQTPEELAQAPYEDDLFYACRFTGELPINHKRLIGPAPDQAQIITYDETRREWTFRYSSGSGNASTESAGIFTDFEVRVTFPGRVLSASGSGRIEGNTVTWSDPKDMYLKEGMRATASADPDLSWLWLTLGVIALAGVGAGIVLVARSRRRPRPLVP